ncbi:hypothetical protein A2412_00180 [Candidatus Peribacteria bacterium RIFOXYC1_FULL_58_8]|nr:MAG: hypothetical protein A2412_00180 [Candidatus Peribacteria bacterium RIFOXYC1_FULL_58_8]
MRSSRSLSLLLIGAMLVPALTLADDDDASSSSSSMTSSSSSSSVSSSSSSSSSAPDSSKGRRRKALPPIVAGCIQTAVDAREQSVLTAVTTYTSSVLSAFQQKKSALHDA